LFLSNKLATIPWKFEFGNKQIGDHSGRIYMLVRTRKMKNLGKGVRLPEESSSSEEDIEMSPPAKSMVDELRSYLDTRIQEKMEALNKNARIEPPMVQKDDTTQLLLQILSKLGQTMSNTDQNIAALVQGMP
jgi:hypothetical protein